MECQQAACQPAGQAGEASSSSYSGGGRPCGDPSSAMDDTGVPVLPRGSDAFRSLKDARTCSRLCRLSLQRRRPAQCRWDAQDTTCTDVLSAWLIQNCVLAQHRHTQTQGRRGTLSSCRAPLLQAPAQRPGGAPQPMSHVQGGQPRQASLGMGALQAAVACKTVGAGGLQGT